MTGVARPSPTQPAPPVADPETDRRTAERALAALMAPARDDLRRASALGVAAALIWLPQAALVGLCIQGLLDEDGGAVTPALAALGFAALGILRAVLDAAAARWATAAGESVAATARRDLIGRETRRALRDPARLPAGALAALAAEKTAALVPYAARYRVAYVRTMVVPFTILAMALPLSWAVALVLIVAGPLIPVFMALVGLAAREASQRQMVEVGTLNALLLERLQALVDIRLLDATGAVLDGFRDAAESLRTRTMAVLQVAFLSSAVLELFSALGVALVAVYVGFTLLGELNFGHWGGLGVGAGVFLILLAPAFFEPMRELAAAWHDKAAALAVAEELDRQAGAAAAPMPGQGGPAEPLAGPPRITARALAVRTPGGWLRFGDVAIAAGERVAVTGPSGAGKSTLLALLAGLQAPDAGRVMVAGVALGPETADGWRARLGWLPQSPHFLAGSLRRNLSPHPVAPARMADALAMAAAQGIVERLPRGLDTRLGETGTGVSGGEARRLMLARLILQAPEVVLADEPTADLDPETAAQVIAALEGLARQGATLIVASHDPRLIARMDRTVVLAGPQEDTH